MSSQVLHQRYEIHRKPRNSNTILTQSTTLWCVSLSKLSKKDTSVPPAAGPSAIDAIPKTQAVAESKGLSYASQPVAAVVVPKPPAPAVFKISKVYIIVLLEEHSEIRQS
jgi:hypothetical protein